MKKIELAGGNSDDEDTNLLDDNGCDDNRPTAMSSSYIFVFFCISFYNIPYMYTIIRVSMDISTIYVVIHICVCVLFLYIGCFRCDALFTGCVLKRLARNFHIAIS